MYQLYAFTFFFTFPLLKVLKGNIVFQLLLIWHFHQYLLFARIDQRTEVPIVYPDADKVKWIAYVYYAIPILLIASLASEETISQHAQRFDQFGARIHDALLFYDYSICFHAGFFSC